MTDSERDLVDAVLAGRTDGIPDALWPVADTLAALRAAPASAELSGEAAARADFRAFMRGIGPADPALTLVLPAAQAESPPRSAARHRRRRPPARSGVLFSPAVLLGTAAAAVIAIVVGLTSAGPGSLQNLARFGPSAAAKSSAAGSGQRTSVGSLQGKATAEPTPSPVISYPAAPQQPLMNTLCRQYLGFFSHPESGPARQAEAALGKEIANIAKIKVTRFPWGGFRAYGYCAQYLYGKSHKAPWHQQGMPGPASGWPGSGGATGTGGQEGSGSGSGGGSGH